MQFLCLHIHICFNNLLVKQLGQLLHLLNWPHPLLNILLLLEQLLEAN
ncbi:unnamed protein product [Meloidogyne enterolobii]|uniref:Uncharacterized protein n=1 Tax=Meloidogyne enterolobii TaxID=390850 RepID=A0ACB0XZT3_MELEN